MKVCYFCDCEVRELNEDGLCGICVEEIIPKCLQEETDEENLDEEE